MIRKYDEEIDFEKQWHDLTKLLDEAIQLIHEMITEAPRRTDTITKAETWLSDIQ